MLPPDCVLFMWGEIVIGYDYTSNKDPDVWKWDKAYDSL